MLQNFLACRDSPIIPLRRSLSLSPSQARAKSLIPTIIFCRPPYHSSPASISLSLYLSLSLSLFLSKLSRFSWDPIQRVLSPPSLFFPSGLSLLWNATTKVDLYTISQTEGQTFNSRRRGHYFFFPVTEGQQGLDIILPAVISNSRFETYIMDEIVYFLTVLCCLVLCN